MESVKQRESDSEKAQYIKKAIVAISFILNIAILFYFKYINFAIDIWERVFSKLGLSLHIPAIDVVLPVGISFYIFQALSYTMDVYRDEIYAEKNFFRYALFVSFFPQLVAGPIERSKNLLRQLAVPTEFNYDNARDGLLAMLWGYFLKLVIADRCAVLVNRVYNDVYSYSGAVLVLASVMFAIQIYCDFMSYSIIAQGAAKVLGYKLIDNFNMPYFSVSIKDFWRRWHISLSSWLRDYLYIPLGGNRKGRLRKNINSLITFLISGLWHGAAYTFVFWGLLHGIYQILEDVLSPICEKIYMKLGISDSKLLHVVKVLLTFILVDIAWVFFRANSMKEALYVLRYSLTIESINEIIGNIIALGMDRRNVLMLIVGCVILLISSLMKYNGMKIRSWLLNRHFCFRYVLYWSCVVMIVFSMDITGQEFIYFQF